MEFNTKGHEVEEKSFVSKYLTPGIHEAKIQKIEFTESNGGTEGLLVVLEGKPDADLDGNGKTADTKWWMSTNAWPYTKDRLVIMADKLGVRDALDAINAGTAAEYAVALNTIFGGKAARWKLSGEEIEGKEGKNNWFKAGIAGYGFVEPMSITAEASKLKFDDSNKYDMKRLAPSDTSSPFKEESGISEDTWS
jgi:hypothetical protein